MGVRTLDELTDNLAALNATLPPAFVEQLAALRIDDETFINPGKWGIA